MSTRRYPHRVTVEPVNAPIRGIVVGFTWSCLFWLLCVVLPLWWVNR